MYCNDATLSQLLKNCALNNIEWPRKAVGCVEVAYPPLHPGELGMGVMGASNGRAHYLADHLLLGGRNCLSVADRGSLNGPAV